MKREDCKLGSETDMSEEEKKSITTTPFDLLDRTIKCLDHSVAELDHFRALWAKSAEPIECKPFNLDDRRDLARRAITFGIQLYERDKECDEENLNEFWEAQK
jgi:hypothetical protein